MIVLSAFLISLCASYALTAGIIWLVCMVASLEFSWGIVTSVWLVCMLLKMFFGK